MERRETISVKMSDIEECIRAKILKEFPELENEDVQEINLKSNIKFILFEVVRYADFVRKASKDGEVIDHE